MMHALQMCNSETGRSYTSIVCDDDNACNTDWCDDETGCVVSPMDCDDYNECTDDFCDSTSGCYYVEVIYNSACTTVILDVNLLQWIAMIMINVQLIKSFVPLPFKSTSLTQPWFSSQPQALNVSWALSNNISLLDLCV